jgi:hypothetical protein
LVITFSYVLGIYYVEATYGPGRLSFESGPSPRAGLEPKPVVETTAAPAYLLDLDIVARPQSRFEFIDTSGFGEELIAALRLRTGREVQWSRGERYALPETCLGTIHVSVQAWQQHQGSPDENHSLSRARLPEHVAMQLGVETRGERGAWDGYHDLEVTQDSLTEIGLLGADQARRAHLRGVVEKLLSQLPGEGWLKETR